MKIWKLILGEEPELAAEEDSTQYLEQQLKQLQQRSQQYKVAWVPNDFMEYFERVAKNRGCQASDVFLEALHEHLMRHKEEAKR